MVLSLLPVPLGTVPSTCTPWHCPFYLYHLALSLLPVPLGTVPSTCTPWHCPFYLYPLALSLLPVPLGTVPSTCTPWHCPFYLYPLALSLLPVPLGTVPSTCTPWHCPFYLYPLALSLLPVPLGTVPSTCTPWHCPFYLYPLALSLLPVPLGTYVILTTKYVWLALSLWSGQGDFSLALLRWQGHKYNTSLLAVSIIAFNNHRWGEKFGIRNLITLYPKWRQHSGGQYRTPLVNFEAIIGASSLCSRGSRLINFQCYFMYA